MLLRLPLRRTLLNNIDTFCVRTASKVSFELTRSTATRPKTDRKFEMERHENAHQTRAHWVEAGPPGKCQISTRRVSNLHPVGCRVSNLHPAGVKSPPGWLPGVKSPPAGCQISTRPVPNLHPVGCRVSNLHPAGAKSPPSVQTGSDALDKHTYMMVQNFGFSTTAQASSVEPDARESKLTPLRTFK